MRPRLAVFSSRSCSHVGHGGLLRLLLHGSICLRPCGPRKSPPQRPAGITPFFFSSYTLTLFFAPLTRRPPLLLIERFHWPPSRFSSSCTRSSAAEGNGTSASHLRRRRPPRTRASSLLASTRFTWYTADSNSASRVRPRTPRAMTTTTSRRTAGRGGWRSSAAACLAAFP